MYDDSKAGVHSYPLYTISLYPEIGLNHNLMTQKISDKEFLMKNAYLFVIDSLGFSDMMKTCASHLNPNAAISYTNRHYEVKLTYNGISKIYGGDGNGGDNSVSHKLIRITFLTVLPLMK